MLARDLEVQAEDAAPTPTGITVRRGESLHFRAGGTWCLGGRPPRAECGPPDGIRRANPEELPLILSSAKIGTLIGRIGDGPWFEIGRDARVKARRRGRLVVLFNERACCYGDNSRRVRVTVASEEVATGRPVRHGRHASVRDGSPPSRSGPGLGGDPGRPATTSE